MSDNLSPALQACLDRQIWHMLTGRLAHLAKGSGAALRIDQRYGPFAVLRDDSDEAHADLRELVTGAGDELWFVETGETPPPPGFRTLRTRALLQMVADDTAGPQENEDGEAVELGDTDVGGMTALALATKPGPWGPLTHRYGPFYGIFREGRLAAMAGQRMLPCDGIAEVSGVCTWPEFQGQGLGRRLTRHVMARLRAAGERPYLHTYADNDVAIGLYASLGFAPRREMMLTVLGPA